MPGALDRLAKTAERLIQQYGSSAVLVQTVSGGGYDASTMKNKPTEDNDLNVVITPPSIIQDLSDGNTTERNFETYVKGIDLNPKNLETLTHKGKVYKIIEANPIYSGEIIAVWQLILGG